MDAFKTAYTKPRVFLDLYVESILSVCRTHPTLNSHKSLNSLRGYLDDSMINFLSGNSETINVIDKKTGKRVANIKHVPKGRNKYISLCMALGMTGKDIDRFLEMMGYAPLDIFSSDEGKLISALTDWERTHPVQRTFKSKYIDGNQNVPLTVQEEQQAYLAAEGKQYCSDAHDHHHDGSHQPGLLCKIADVAGQRHRRKGEDRRRRHDAGHIRHPDIDADQIYREHRTEGRHAEEKEEKDDHIEDIVTLKTLEHHKIRTSSSGKIHAPVKVFVHTSALYHALFV